MSLPSDVKLSNLSEVTTA